MYIVKLPNAAAHKITVTGTATTLLSLIDTAASTAAGLKGDLNAVLMSVEDGDIRVTFDGTDPTSANGLLISSGARTYFSNVPLSKMKLIRTGGSNVAVSIEVGYSSPGESSIMSGSGGGASSSAGDVAHDAADSGNPVKIGFKAYDPSSLPSDVASGDRVNAIADLKGRQFVYNAMQGAGEDLSNNVLAVVEKPMAVSTYAPDNDTSAAAEASSITKASPGTLYGATMSNGNAAVRFFQFHNSTTVPADTAVPVIVLQCPAASTIAVEWPKGRYFSTGIVWCNSSTQNTKTIGGADSLADINYK